MSAACNYQLVAKEAGFYAHNPKYAVQLLIDSIADLGADVSAYARPQNDNLLLARARLEGQDGT